MLLVASVSGPVKIKFNDLSRLLWCRYELPFLDGVLAGLHQQWVTANNSSALDMPVGRDDYFDLDLSGDVHAARQLRIGGCGLGLYLAPAFIGSPRLRKPASPQKKASR